MNGRVRAGRTTAGPGRVAAAGAALGLAVLGVVAGPAAASDLAAPGRVTTGSGARSVAVAPGSTCEAEALVGTFVTMGTRHAPGTALAV